MHRPLALTVFSPGPAALQNVCPCSCLSLSSFQRKYREKSLGNLQKVTGSLPMSEELYCGREVWLVGDTVAKRGSLGVIGGNLAVLVPLLSG